MAPEFPPKLSVMDLRLEGGRLRGILEYVEAQDENLLRVRWAVENKPEDYFPVGEGVAFVYDLPGILKVPISKDATPEPLGNSRYRLQEGLSKQQPWLMYILILPAGYTISNPQPVPVSAKEFKGRLALYWVLRGEELGRTKVEWTLKELGDDLSHEIEKINDISSSQVPIESSIEVDTSTSSPNIIFISYSHRDFKWLQRLQIHLKPLERQGTVVRWDDTLIVTGKKWRDEIKKALNSAKAAILLISADFLASDFIANNELPPLLKVAKERGIPILSVIISPCLFAETKDLSDFQTVNPPSRPLVNMSKGKQEETLLKVAQEIQKALHK